MRPGRRRRRTSGTRWGWILLLSVLVNVAGFQLLALYLETGSTRPERPMRLKLSGYRPSPLEKKEPEEEPIPEDAQIVELPETDEPEPEEEVETKRLATRTSRTEKEVRSERVAPADRAKEQGLVKPTEPSPVRSAKSSSPDPTVTSEEEERLSLAAPREERPPAEKGSERPKSVLFDGEEDRILLPASTRRSQIASLQGLSDEFATDDYLPDVDERGLSTILNANRYKYADFFYRVKDAVRRHWHPDQVYRMRDPTGRVYGVKDRYTVLHVTLDSEGTLKNLVTTRRSGLDFMDAEARAAFNRASPFPNPPRGLVDENAEVRFQFGFFFEISSGKHRFQWKRL